MLPFVAQTRRVRVETQKSRGRVTGGYASLLSLALTSRPPPKIWHLTSPRLRGETGNAEGGGVHAQGPIQQHLIRGTKRVLRSRKQVSPVIGTGGCKGRRISLLYVTIQRHSSRLGLNRGANPWFLFFFFFSGDLDRVRRRRGGGMRGGGWRANGARQWCACGGGGFSVLLNSGSTIR